MTGGEFVTGVVSGAAIVIGVVAAIVFMVILAGWVLRRGPRR